MILTCPDCGTRYLTKPEAIGVNGRTVRCASCAATWFVAAPEPESLKSAPLPLTQVHHADVKERQNTAFNATDSEKSAQDSDTEAQRPSPNAASLMRERNEAKRVSRRYMGISLLWLITGAVLSGLAASAYTFRHSIVDKYPKSATLYQKLGIDVVQGALVFDSILTRQARVEGLPTLIVEGQVHNPAREEKSSQLITLSLHGTHGTTLSQWFVELPKDRLAQGETLGFVTQMPNPPLDAVSLHYKFSDQPSADGAIVPLGNINPDAKPSAELATPQAL